ncbi:alpha-N-arabinofuranosidase [Prevotella sp. PMUR]|uniref:non-reducing end alpha-L-arabinofuranosidase n=2 Tax=Xylanibacter muris TaxID=2736290 RepID=A0ABX2AM81_9BACT|nr:alpha-N-arabinofuranosidase [Xylanibacter muris]
MYTPFITRLSSGGYAAVFSVNDSAPCFAVAFSDDMVTWRPQDYPKMSVRGCLAPVIRCDSDNAYTVLFKTKDGKVRKTATDARFRHFTPDVAATSQEYEKADVKRDTVEIGGKRFAGFKWAADSAFVDGLDRYFANLSVNGRKSAENLKDDASRFAFLGGKPYPATLTIEGKKMKDISDKLVGVFFEDISYAADGGLYAELVQNRDFEYSSSDRGEWNATTSWRAASGKINVLTDNPISKNNPHYVAVTSDTLYNSGWDGIRVMKGAKYDFSFYVRMAQGKGKRFIVKLVDNGREIASATVTVKQGKTSEWTKYDAVLTASEDAEKAELAVVALKDDEAHLDMISLFPQDTFNGRKNGLRKDLAQTIADLHPKFIRFPGGCMSHGDGLGNIYHWNHTVGPLYDRVPDRNIWRYHQTRGLGFYEYFQFCEDIQAEPLPVLAAGVPCQNSGADSDGYGGQQGGIPMEDMPAYIEEILNMIEWANGDPATSKWARMRADAGHPAPFNLKYIGIGNEDIISTVFEERCLMICKAIKERYPEITVCGTVGPFHAPSSDYIEGWKFANENRNVIDMVDEHYYESVGWFLNNARYYDNYDRKAPKVYLGEYAARTGKGGLDCALAEAFYLCNIERNADVVEMTSYAPLLSKNGHSNWSPDMIYFDNGNITLTPSYQTQRLFSTYYGNKYITSSLKPASGNSDTLAVNRIAASVVMDKWGKVFLKVVNVLPVELSLDIDAKNLPYVSRMRYEGISGKPGQVSLKPHTGEYKVDLGGKFHITLPPYSFRVIQM